jgi:GMP synthase-like glutamine amidotransferase
MRIHYLQHVPFEDAANIAVWARGRGYPITRTLLYENEPLPPLDSFDLLAIMGGPMNVYENDAYPWLVGEKRFIRDAIDGGRRVLGICLGAQLVADVLGGRVTGNAEKEIGWFEVTLTDDARQDSLLAGFPPRFVPFHWHGDTFSIPPGAVRLARSEACENQAFQYGDRVLGLQFHLEYSADSFEQMQANCGEELVEGRYIQKADEMLAAPERRQDSERLLKCLLEAMERRFRYGN